MAQCQNFFDDSCPSVCKSSSSNEQSPASTTLDGDDPHLQLRLGPLVDVSKRKQHEMVRPIPLYPSFDRQRSGNYGNATGSSPLFRGRSDASLAEKALFSKDSAFSTPLSISREQVWQSLQNSNVVLGHEKAFCGDTASSILGRRSTSMQVLIPASNEMSEAGPCAGPIRRSCSNGIPPSRQSSLGQESLVEESPHNSLPSYHQEDAFEFQKKKEMQAHRRLEARKRRRLLIDKQQKKPRQRSGTDFRKTSLPDEKASVVRTQRLVSKNSLESKGFYKAMTVKVVGDDVMSENADSIVTMSESADSKVTMPLPPSHMGIDNKIEPHKALHKEWESTSSGSKQVQGAVSSVQQLIASCDLSSLSGDKEDSPLAQSGKEEMCEVVKLPQSCCSETESTETKEKELDLSERESSNQKSSTGNHFDHGGSAMANLPSKPMPYPRMLPAAALVSKKVQLISSRSSHLPPTNMGNNDDSYAWPKSQRKFSKLLNEVSRNFKIKRSVGTFSDGKWRIPDDNSEFPSIRRTASNMSQVVPESHCRAKKLETYTSLSASQLKFAGMVSNNAAGTYTSSKSSGSQLGFSFEVRSLGKIVKEDLNVCTVEEKVPARGSGRMGDMVMPPHMVRAQVKVKEEEVTMEDTLSEHSFARDPVVPKMEVEPIKRQTSASFSELPCVTTTGRGPNGRTINGVMYITACRSVRLVCRCHGKHMSPVEFVEHAGSTDLSNPLRNIVVNDYSMLNNLATTPV